jgi:hypothetical protein
MSFKTRVTYQKDKTEISQIKVALCPQYIYKDSKLLASVVYFADPVYGPFGQSSTLQYAWFQPQTSQQRN